MKVTDSLLAEHGILKVALDSVAESASQAKDLAEIAALASLLERLLHVHAESEEQFILAPLDHVLEQKGERQFVHQTHLEIDARLKEAQVTTDISKARCLIKGAIATSRKHFEYEEELIFPKCEKLLSAETLESLGQAMMYQRHARPGEK